MTVNDVNLSVVFRGISGLNSWGKKGEELYLRDEIIFSFVKTLVKRIVTPCPVIGVRWSRIVACCTIPSLQRRCTLLSSKGATILVRGNNEHLLDASRRRSFYGEVASDRFGYHSLLWFSGIILTSSPYPLHLIKGKELSWTKSACSWLGIKLLELFCLEIVSFVRVALSFSLSR